MNADGTAGTARYYLQDGLGSVLAVADSADSTVATQRFDAWGNRIASSGTIPQYGYTGREPDETGLIYYRARYYNPAIGRFVSRDPAGFAGGLNFYAYCGNGPTLCVDPSGMLWSQALNAVNDYFANPLVQDTLTTIGNGAKGLLNVPSNTYNGGMSWLEQFTHSPEGSFGRVGTPVTVNNPVEQQVTNDLLGVAGTAFALTPIRFGGAAGALEREAAGEVPTVTFSSSRAPGIKQNFDNAVANGAPTQLNRVDAATRDANRRAALRGQSPAPAGQSLDEYPFACSAQGGCGSFVSAVPVGEQNYQGGVLSRFFQDYGVQPGDPFNVMFGP